MIEVIAVKTGTNMHVFWINNLGALHSTLPVRRRR